MCTGRLPADARLRWCVLSLALSVLAPREGLAEKAAPSEMDSVCRNWLSYVVHLQGDWAGDAAPAILRVQDLRIDDLTIARCYTIAPRGHVVVPVLKELPPIKTYSEDCELDVDERGGFAELLREVLGNYARQFIALYGSMEAVPPRNEPPPFGPGHRARWERLSVDPPTFNAALEQLEGGPRAQVGPLLTTNWHQREPYNDLCPMGDGGRCKVGCLATAVAQLMRYHQWPPTGLGGEAYYWWGDNSCGGSTEGDWLSADFRDPYDWASMPDSCGSPPCSPAQEAALAELSFEVGVAFNMAYGYCGTGPMNNDLAGVLHEYFRYDPGVVRERRRDYALEGWFALIQGEIDAGRPTVYYFQVYENGIGHAVVCDGWSDDGGELRYHINYGWGGSYTGWYAIDEIHNTYDPMVELMDRNIKPGSGFTFSVRPDGLGSYPTIQDAVDNVLDGDVVTLASGIFTGARNRDVTFRGKSITIRSADLDPVTCVIDCGGDPAEHRGFLFVSGEGPAAILEGVTITGGFAAGPNRGGAILCSGGSSPTIRDCIVRDNRATNAGGGISCSASSPLLERCVFSRNTTDGTGGAICATDGARPGITGCTLFANASAAGGGAGVWVSGSSVVSIENSIIAGGLGGEAVRCDAGSPAPALRCCDLYGNAGGDWVGCVADQLGSNGNISADPLFCDPAEGEYHIQVASPCGPDANPACGLIGAWPLGCRHYVVRPDGAGDLPTIQAAIDVAEDSDFVDLANGVYVGDGNRDLDFGGRRITVRSQSGIPDSCIIDCEGTQGEPHRGFTFRSRETGSCRVEGIKVVGGYMPTYSGGAIWCTEGSSPTITNCVFSGNRSEASGGAIWCSAQAQPVFANCAFFGNASNNGGAIFAHRAEPVMRNCTIAGNTAGCASGIASAYAALTVENSILAFNTGAQAVTCLDGAVTFRCCDIYGNEQGDWVGGAAGQHGQNGNICLDPLFCDRAEGDYRLGEISPCAPFSPQNPECDLVGAYAVGCALAATDDPAAGERSPTLVAGGRNPSAGTARFFVDLGGAWRCGRVRIGVFDLSGCLVRTLIDGDLAGARHDVVWDGTSDQGRAVPAGVYFVRLRVSGIGLSRSVVLIR